MSSIEAIKKLRAELGLGLKEAKDAIDHYGTYEKAMVALAPDAPVANDPYANAVKSSERWHSKASTYKSGLIRVLNATNDDKLKLIINEAIAEGDSV